MSYTVNQRNYFNRLSATGLEGLNIEKLSTLYYKMLATKLVKFLQDLPEDTIIDSPLAVTQQEEGLSALFGELNSMMRLRFRSQLNTLWNKAFDLGLKHQVEDILYNNTPIKRQWDTDFKVNKRFDSVFGANNSLIAHFSEADDIARAQKEYERLADSLEKVQRSGKYDKLTDDEDIVGRYTPLERAYFLDSLTEISNVRRRAEASKFNYISDEYMKRRFRVLSEDFADKYDENTKKAVEKFLLRDVRYVRSIQNNNLIARNARDSIADTLEKQTLEVINDRDGTKKRKLDFKDKRLLYKRAQVILRTETSLAYNVGKLIGYSAPEDIEKKFKWVADWELQDTKEGYVVCNACRAMHGTQHSAQKLLAAAMRSDTGIVNYKGTRRSKTDFKNPSIPVIPFHPNCLHPNCLILMCDGTYKKILDIQVGEQVYGPKSHEPKNVIETHKNWHSGLVYNILTNKGQRLAITGNHPVYTQRGWVNAEDLNRATDVLYMGEVLRLCAGISREDFDTDRQASVSETEIDLSKFSSVGIASITTETYTGYVYNLSIEDDEMYMANNLLVHNCSCRFVRVFDPKEEVVGKQEAAVPVTSRGLLRQTQTTDISDMVLPKVLGATLLVGGTFMLARSNAWKKVFTIAQTVKLPPLQKAEAVLDAVDYIDDVIGGPAADITKDILKDGVTKAAKSSVRV